MSLGSLCSFRRQRKVVKVIFTHPNGWSAVTKTICCRTIEWHYVAHVATMKTMTASCWPASWNRWATKAIFMAFHLAAHLRGFAWVGVKSRQKYMLTLEVCSPMNRQKKYRVHVVEIWSGLFKLVMSFKIFATARCPCDLRKLLERRGWGKSQVEVQHVYVVRGGVRAQRQMSIKTRCTDL